MKSRTNNNLPPSSSSLLKREFLKKWMKWLRIYTDNYYKSKKDLTVFERRKAIKLSADVAIASTRLNPSTQWSRALLSNSPANGDNHKKIAVQKISGNHLACFEKSNNSNRKKPLITCTKKILRRSNKLCRRVRVYGRRSIVQASSIAKRLLKNKTRVLRSLVPGGEQIDDAVSLIKETLDYIVFLRVQVDVMRRIADAAESRLDPACGVYKRRCDN